MTRLTQVVIADEPSRWQHLGLRGSTDDHGRWHVVAGSVTVTVDASLMSTGQGIVAWGLDRPAPGADELGVTWHEYDGPHLGADARLLGVDHVVLMTSSLQRTSDVIAERLGAPLKRVREAGGGVTQGFHRLGDVIVEVVERPDAPPGPAHCWGLVFSVDDLDVLVAAWGDEVVSRPRAAVQPGRRIASLRREAGVATAVAFMSPHRSVDSPE